MWKLSLLDVANCGVENPLESAENPFRECGKERFGMWKIRFRNMLCKPTYPSLESLFLEPPKATLLLSGLSLFSLNDLAGCGFLCFGTVGRREGSGCVP